MHVCMFAECGEGGWCVSNVDLKFSFIASNSAKSKTIRGIIRNEEIIHPDNSGEPQS